MASKAPVLLGVHMDPHFKHGFNPLMEDDSDVEKNTAEESEDGDEPLVQSLTKLKLLDNSSNNPETLRECALDEQKLHLFRNKEQFWIPKDRKYGMCINRMFARFHAQEKRNIELGVKNTLKRNESTVQRFNSVATNSRLVEVLAKAVGIEPENAEASQLPSPAHEMQQIVTQTWLTSLRKLSADRLANITPPNNTDGMAIPRTWASNHYWPLICYADKHKHLTYDSGKEIGKQYYDSVEGYAAPYAGSYAYPVNMAQNMHVYGFINGLVPELLSETRDVYQNLHEMTWHPGFREERFHVQRLYLSPAVIRTWSGEIYYQSLVIHAMERLRMRSRRPFDALMRFLPGVPRSGSPAAVTSPEEADNNEIEPNNFEYNDKKQIELVKKEVELFSARRQEMLAKQARQRNNITSSAIKTAEIRRFASADGESKF